MQPFDEDLLETSEDEVQPISDTMAALELLRRQFPEAAQVCHFTGFKQSIFWLPKTHCVSTLGNAFHVFRIEQYASS